MTDKNPRQMTLAEALTPIMESEFELRTARILLHQMFTATVMNAPDDELDNFTARRLTPVYLALCETLENLELVEK